MHYVPNEIIFLQVRTRELNDALRDTFCGRYPEMSAAQTHAVAASLPRFLTVSLTQTGLESGFEKRCRNRRHMLTLARAFPPEDEEKRLGEAAQIHNTQQRVVIDPAEDVVDRQRVIDHRGG